MGTCYREIVFGAVAPPLKEQLESQGFKLEEDDLQYIKRLADAITLLNLNSVAVDSETRKMRQRLLNKIKARIIRL